ncbi:GNAT family N-acetyltransferase [Desnuesiella massiliensis]|uniref:GNAT family N-acetyltransferase n=1 Tax=Desnuesiella massiliensis TaxID=1650662 RepID=UPI0006E3D5AF|nr:GNAT family N-acetyltransferase [Desnuesiella massiliensis]
MKDENLIQYVNGSIELIDFVGPLWTKLNHHHKNNSKHFSERYERNTFEERKKGLLEKAKDGKMKIFLCKDIKNNIDIGYCISTVDNKNVGEIDSLYVEPEYRKLGIGDALMNQGLAWLEHNKVSTITIGVASGNEKAFGFYEKYGFYPKATILSRK